MVEHVVRLGSNMSPFANYKLRKTTFQSYQTQNDWTRELSGLSIWLNKTKSFRLSDIVFLDRPTNLLDCKILFVFVRLSNQEMSQTKISNNTRNDWLVKSRNVSTKISNNTRNDWLPQILLKFGSWRREEGGWVACEGDKN